MSRGKRYSLQDNVGWNFKDENACAEKLIPSVDIIGGDVQVLKNGICHCIGDVPTRDLHHEEPNNEQGHQDGIRPGHVSYIAWKS